jgi:hypothetical protein
VEELLADDRHGDEMVRMMGIYSGVNIQQCVKKQWFPVWKKKVYKCIHRLCFSTSMLVYRRVIQEKW